MPNDDASGVIAPLVFSRVDVQRVTTMSMSTIDKLEAAGQFPARISLGERRVGWLVAEIEAWLESRARARTEAAESERAARMTPGQRSLASFGLVLGPKSGTADTS
jgi:prophage regulatory protein